MQNLFRSTLSMVLGRCLFCYSVIMKQKSVNLQSVLVELAIIKNKLLISTAPPFVPPPSKKKCIK